MSHIEEARRLVAALKQRQEEFVATKLPFVVRKEDYLLDAAKDAVRDWAVGGIECLLATIDAQAAEITRLEALMSGDKAAVRFEHNEIQVKHWAARLMAISFADTLGDAENYISLELTPEGKEPVVVTVRRKFGKSPEEMLRAEVERLRGQIAAMTASHRGE